MSKQAQICEALAKLGHKEVEYDSRYYRVFAHSHIPIFYFVGRRGAIRKGATPSDSFPMTKEMKAAMLSKVKR